MRGRNSTSTPARRTSPSAEEADFFARLSPKDRELLATDASDTTSERRDRRHRSELRKYGAAVADARPTSLLRREADGEDVAAEVAKLARRRFKRRFGFLPTSSQLDQLRLDPEKVEVEREARALWKRLQEFDARERSKSFAGRGPARAALLNLLEHAFVGGSGFLPGDWKDKPRAFLVQQLDRWNVFGVELRTSKSAHAFTAGDMALLAALLGLAKARPGDAPEAVLEREEEAMKKAIDEHGKRLASGRQPPRGPERRGTSYPRGKRES